MTPTDSTANPTQAAAATRIRIDSTLSYQLDAACDFVFLIHAANGPGQAIAREELRIEPPTPHRSYVDAHSGNRFLRLRAGAASIPVSFRSRRPLACSSALS